MLKISLGETRKMGEPDPFIRQGICSAQVRVEVKVGSG